MQIDTSARALSTINFRDIGGLRTENGRSVRSGLFYRSEGPASFLEAHLAELRTLGVRTVCDLRSDGEREAAPHNWCGPGCRILNLVMNTDMRAQGKEAWEGLHADPSAAELYRVINESYRAMPGALLPHLHSIVSALIDGQTPLVLHCTAGKDRTGVAVALILTLLGVRRSDIAADYAKTALFMGDPRLVASVEEVWGKNLGVRPDAEMLALMMGIDEAHLATAFEEVGEQWGGVPAYFAAGNVDEAVQERLRATMLE